VGVGAGHQEYAERTGHPQGNGNMNANGDQGHQANNQDYGDIDFKHAAASSFAT
jgi:hypothetical protein